MTHNEKGSATLHSLFAAVLLLTALAAATLWSTISTARHQLATAADLTALSAAESLATPPPTTTPSAATGPDAPVGGTTISGATASRATDTTASTTTASTTTGSTTTGSGMPNSGITPSDPTTPCATAARIAALHKVDLIACHPTPTSVTIQVALQLHLPFTIPTVTTTARAGPL